MGKQFVSLQIKFYLQMGFFRFALLNIALFILLPFNMAFAQQEFVVNGVVIEKGAKIRIALAEISNSRNKYSVGSNDMGLFQIRAMVGDTISIVKRGFNLARVIVSSTKDLVIYLERSTTLNEVVVFGKTKKQTLDEIKRDFKNKGSF